MRILQVNKFWYPRGGDCVVAMATAQLLRRMGHEVGVFTMNYASNVADPHIVAEAPAVDFGGGVAARLQYLSRMLGGAGVQNAFAQALNMANPEVVHLHNVHSYLSPVMARIAHEHGCRVVWTMHDYKLICAQYSCLRGGKPCTDCLDHPLDVVNRRCMKGSLMASIAALFENTKWNRDVLCRWVDTFICPSEFMAALLRSADVPQEKIGVLHNFLPADRRVEWPVAQGREPYCCYVGRLSPEKGLVTLVEAASRLPGTLRIAGDGPLRGDLERRCAGNPHIELLGQLDATQVAALVGHAAFAVVPSEWWENCPMSIIEALCAGTPVVATTMGGIPELLDNSNSILAEPANADALEQALRQAWQRQWDCAAIARHAAARFDEQKHYRALMNFYSTPTTGGFYKLQNVM